MIRQIQALERELVFSLLERRNRKFSLTPAGEHFYTKNIVRTCKKQKNDYNNC